MSATIKPRFRRSNRPRKVRRTTRTTIFVALISLFYMLLMIPLLALEWISEGWWVGTVFAYSPRVVFLIPPVVFIMGSFLWHRKSIVVNLISIVIAGGPLMHLHLPQLSIPELPDTDQRIRFATCNVQGFEPDFGAVLTELGARDPNVIVLQESIGDHSLIDQWFGEWNVYRTDSFLLASKFPLKHVETFYSTVFAEHHGTDKRTTAVLVEIDGPTGRFRVVNVHLMTARHGLSTVTPGEVLRGGASSEIAGFDVLRQKEADEALAFVQAIPADLPLIVAGDFNTPSHSNHFSSRWGFLRNVFEEVGFGYGYTAPNTQHKVWPDYTPWLRIDHILASDVWDLHRCEVGTGRGSDHRPIMAVLSLPVSQSKPDQLTDRSD